MIYWIAWLIMCPIVWICWPTKIIGKKYLKLVKKKAAIFCSNHQTNSDAIIYKVKVRPTVKIMAKKSLFKNKLLGGFLKKCGAYPVDRGGNDISAVKTSLKILKENKQLLIFPEGTRVQDSESMDIKTGVVSFALKTDSFIIPTYFRKITKAFVRNTLLIGKPFKFSELEDFKDKTINKELIAKANDVLSDKFNYLKTVDINEYKKLLKKDLKKSLQKKN